MEAAITDATRAIFVEAVSNPLLRLADLPGLGGGRAAAGHRPPGGQHLRVPGAPPAARARRHGGAPQRDQVPVRPRRRHGRRPGRVPPRWSDAARAQAVRIGLNLGPFDAWLTLRGVRTLALRMERHSANALELARFLAERSEVARVHYPGLPDHPQHALARKLLPDGFGGMLSFELAGGAPAVERLLARWPGAGPSGREALIAFAPSFGDVTTTWTLPGADVAPARCPTTSGRSSASARVSCGCRSGSRRSRICKESLDLGAAGGRDLSGDDLPATEGSDDMSEDSEEVRGPAGDDKKALAHLGTVMPNGAPQVTPVWFDYDGKFFRVNSARGRVKDRNMRRNPAVALSIVDPDNPYRYLGVPGRVVEITEQGADAHIDAWPRSTSARTDTPTGAPGEVRVIYKIAPERVSGMG